MYLANVQSILTLLVCLLMVGCTSPFRAIGSRELVGDAEVEFRGGGTIRLYDINSRGGVMAVNEIVVTRTHVIVFQFDHIANRPFTVAKLERASIARAERDHARFVRLEMRDGITHWVEPFDGKKDEFIAALMKDDRP